MASKFDLNVVTILGSLRKGSYAGSVLRALPALAPGSMGFTPFPSIGDVPHYDFDLETSSGVPHPIALLANAMREADGVIIVSPEYNYSVPGVLKNTIDWLSRVPNQPFANKPVLIQSVSQGPLGGVRMQYHLRQTLVGLSARVFNRPEVMIGLARTKIDEATGELTDTATRDLIRTQLADFAAFMKFGRIEP
jgi:chromate reductase, NAD(P)H dehydrogenase (quinone)